MDIKILKSFLAVAKHKSFSEAARELHTVQPAISRHISALENELGVSLFNRNSRDVVITQAGEQLLRDASKILLLTSQAKANVKRAHSGQVGTLNIAYLSSACLVFMANVVRTYQAQFPDVHITLFEMTVREQIEALKSDKVDIAFSRPLPSTVKQEFACHTIYIDKLVAVVNKNHPLANETEIDLTWLRDDKFILFNRDEALGLFDEIITLCQHVKLFPNIISQPRHMQTLVTEVAAGLGIAIAPFCIRKLYSDGCVFIPLKNVDVKIPVELQFKHNNNRATVAEFTRIVLNMKTDIENSML